MAKSTAAHEFRVEASAYGWSVSEDGRHVGLFVNRERAVDDVRRRYKLLKNLGKNWSVTVNGTGDVGKAHLGPIRR